MELPDRLTLPTPPRLHQHGPTVGPSRLGPSPHISPPIPSTPEPIPIPFVFFIAGRFRSWPGLAWYVCMCWPTTESQQAGR